MNISDNIQSVKKELPNNVTLVAVSKTKSEEEILQAYNSGHKIFGENKVQELVEKYENLPKDIEWHMIGHLQSNKVKYIAPFVNLIHGTDSEKLLKEINKRAKQNSRIINCLLQVHIAEESTKFGFSSSEINNIMQKSSEFKNVNIIGLMGMATFTNNISQIEKEFCSLQQIYKNYTHFTTLSMGMSGDYKSAIKCGSNTIRLGSVIFGNRN
jgi:PLP dependent protein